MRATEPPARTRANGLQRGSAQPGSPELRRLKYLGVLLPVLFLLLVESFRFTVIAQDGIQRAEHVALAVVTGIAVVAFAFLMFYLIERAQQRVVRQNRELSAVTAVSTAVQGELGVDQIIDSALHAVIDASRATEAAVTVFAREGVKEPGIERSVSLAPHANGIGGEVPQLVDIPLSAGTAVVGRLRLHLSPHAADADLLASATLQNIGHQLACAIQIGQLVADLQRRKNEGHGLFDVLLRISNGAPLLDTLGAVARHGRELLGADVASITLNGPTTMVVGLERDGSAIQDVTAGGPISITASAADDGSTVVSIANAGPTRRTVDIVSSLEVQLASRESPFGELWIGRGGPPALTGRDHGFAQTLGELASIAIASARLRESEQQAAIVAERERIAREMHDSLAQVLGVTRLRLLALRPKLQALETAGSSTNGQTPTPLSTEIDELAELTEEAYRDVREAILGLREGSRVDRSLVEGLRAYLEKYSHQCGVRARLDSTLEGEPLLSPRAEVQVIRVIQEALTNVRKHSGASSAVVRLSNGGDWTTFTIEDDGRGFDLGETLLDRDTGFGLHTMRERMELVGGTLEIDSGRGRGTRVVARVPAVPDRFVPTSASSS